MGFITRTLTPRPVKRAMHPVRSIVHDINRAGRRRRARDRAAARSSDAEAWVVAIFATVVGALAWAVAGPTAALIAWFVTGIVAGIIMASAQARAVAAPEDDDEDEAPVAPRPRPPSPWAP